MLAGILEVLIDAVTRGAVEVLRSRLEGNIQASYKDAKELVTEADRRSDAAMSAVFASDLQRLDPSIAFRLEESGATGDASAQWVGADPLDGTNHFACGGTFYSVMAHYVRDGIPLVGVVFQPEVYLPLGESDKCMGRLVYAVRGEGAFWERTEFSGGAFVRAAPRRLLKLNHPPTKSWVCSIPISTKMTDEERARALRVLESGLVSVTTGVGGAGANALMTIFGGQHVYANFGAGEDLDLIPPQVIAEEAGMTVWDVSRRPPVWHVRKQPFVVASNADMAEQVLRAAGV